MRYDEIRKNLMNCKRSHANMQMDTIEFGRFTVMYSDKVDGIIVDTDIVNILKARRWCIDTSGYAVINLNGKSVRLHDVVLALHDVYKPNGYCVDHINHDRLDNRFCNLRIVNPMGNSKNVSKRSNNKSGITGICSDGKRFRAYITIDKKRIDLGSYQTMEDAIHARQEAESRYGFYSCPVTVNDAKQVIIVE